MRQKCIAESGYAKREDLVERALSMMEELTRQALNCSLNNLKVSIYFSDNVTVDEMKIIGEMMHRIVLDDVDSEFEIDLVEIKHLKDDVKICVSSWLPEG